MKSHILRKGSQILVICLLITLTNSCLSKFGDAFGEDFSEYFSIILKPVIEISTLSIIYYGIEEEWPSDKSDFSKLSNKDSLLTILAQFDKLSFFKKQNGNIEITFFCSNFSYENTKVNNLSGRIDLMPTSYINQDTLSINGLIYIDGGKATISANDKKSDKSYSIINNKFKVINSNIIIDNMAVQGYR